MKVQEFTLQHVMSVYYIAYLEIHIYLLHLLLHITKMLGDKSNVCFLIQNQFYSKQINILIFVSTYTRQRGFLKLLLLCHLYLRYGDVLVLGKKNKKKNNLLNLCPVTL